MFSEIGAAAEIQEIADGVEILERDGEISGEGAFNYSEAYVDEGGRYVPRQITGVYREALESGEATEVAAYLKAWSHQESSYSCAAACSSAEIQVRKGDEVPEAALCEIGEAEGWYNPKTGTYIAEIGKFAESQGLTSTRHARELTLADLDGLKKDGAGLIVCVDSEILARPSLVKPFAANHVVEVIGFDNSDPNRPLVLVNNPGDMHGRGAAYEFSHFERAGGATNSGGTLKNVTAIRGEV